MGNLFKSTYSLSPQRGFSLLEMAIVMVIVSTLLGGLLISLSQTQEMNNRTDAEDTIENIVDALYGFAQANGRLPCPATPASGGVEDPVGGGNCNWEYGFVPASTLGLSGGVNVDGLLTDKWLSAYRYSVTTSNANAFTTVGGMQGVVGGISALTPDLQVCDSAACTTITATGVPAVVMSLGADWTNFTSANEVENSGERTRNGYRLPNDLIFVSSSYIEGTFDDLITWMSPSILYTKMITAGQLP